MFQIFHQTEVSRRSKLLDLQFKQHQIQFVSGFVSE